MNYNQFNKKELIELLKEYDRKNEDFPKLNGTDKIYDEILRKYAVKKREHFLAIALNAQLQPLNIDLVAIGSAGNVYMETRDIFKGAIMSDARCVIFAHNHPSGDVTPSEEDIIQTEYFITAGKILGITVIDHLVFSGTRYKSIRGMMPEIFADNNDNAKIIKEDEEKPEVKEDSKGKEKKKYKDDSLKLKI